MMKVFKTISLSIPIVLLLIANSVTVLLASRRFISFEETVDTADLIVLAKVGDIAEIENRHFACLELREILKGDETLKVIRVPMSASEKKRKREIKEGPTDRIPLPAFVLGEEYLIFLIKYPWDHYFSPFVGAYDGAEIIVKNKYVDSYRFGPIELAKYVQKIKGRVDYVNQLELRVFTDKKIYKKNEPVVITVQLKNAGSHLLKLALYDKFGDNSINYKYFYIYLYRLKDRYPIPILLKLDKDGQRFSRGLKPEEEISITIPLTEKYRELYNRQLVLEPGDYELDVRYLDYDWGNYPELANEGFWAGTQKGNRARIHLED